MPHQIVAALRANGLKTIPPLGIGRSGHGAFGPVAVDAMKRDMLQHALPLLKDVPGAQTATPLTEAMVADFGRSTLVVGDQVVSTTGRPNKDGATAAFVALATDEDGRVDENMLWALGQVAHQGTFADARAERRLSDGQREG